MRSNKFRRSTGKGKKLAKTVKTYVRKALDSAIEDKYTSGYLTSTATLNSIPNAWASTALANLAQGPANGQRIGRRIRVKSVHIRGWLAAGDTSNFVRIVICSAEQPPFGSANINTDFIHGNLTNGFLIKVYRDKMYHLNFVPVDGQNVTVQAVPRQVNITVRFKRPFYIRYSDDSTSYFDKMLYINAISDSAAIPNPGFVNGYSTLVYEDA